MTTFSIRTDDPLFPLIALLPLSDVRGGQLPLVGTPGPVRPLSAALGVVPIECGKHDTTASRWWEDDATETTDDGVVKPDTVRIMRTDT